MRQPNSPRSDDKLRSRFTSWLTTLLRRARIDYVRQQKKYDTIVSIEEVPESELAVEDQYAALRSEFEFEEKRLAEAFFSLPIHRRKILTMLFVEDMEPVEIADALHCSPEYVAQQRFRALEKIRKILEEGDQ